ncbi:MAG: hypothetical protein C4516_09535 [Oxalobacter sp.]|nr:MAG: hypothetical protein C4516_09535 [Oxalobacter sp.]
MFQAMKMDVCNKRFLLPLMFACSFLLFGCGSKESEKKTPISIEGIVISETGEPKHKLAIEQFMTEKNTEITKISQAFSKHLAGVIIVDPKNSAKINGLTVPNLVLNGKALNGNHSIPEKLSTEVPGAVATIFAKAGDEFVRVSTSLKKAQSGRTTTEEDRAVGSILNHQHPAYAACLAGKTYKGTATLFGSAYMTEYTPIKNATDEVVGIRFVGMDISGDLVLFKRKLHM